MKRTRLQALRRPSQGFTLVEVVVVMVLLGILAGFVYFGSAKRFKLNAQYSRAYSEMSNIANALELYKIKYNTYPSDVDRDIPPGIQEFLSDDTGSHNWPSAPWNGSIYDYDNWPAEFGNEAAIQISIHFCPLYDEAACAKNYPDYKWLDKNTWTSFSSVYYCVKGGCRAHRNQPATFPGYCVNCKK